jgi:microsomal dipeptidase-like Zn-dependent dipeptidase
MLSHGGLKGACDTERNLSDALMKKFASKGGLVGIGYWDAAVCDPSPEGIVKSIRYAIDLLGLEHVALGSDYDGTIHAPFDTSEISVLTAVMLQSGFSEEVDVISQQVGHIVCEPADTRHIEHSGQHTLTRLRL